MPGLLIRKSRPAGMNMRFDIARTTVILTIYLNTFPFKLF
jgi:hypothetical protein